MRKPVTATPAEMSEALHALAYALGTAEAGRDGATHDGSDTYRRVVARNVFKELLATAPLPYADREQLGTSYNDGYKDHRVKQGR